MRIIYVIGKYITFPGAFLRAFWEHLTCLLLGSPVENTGYLRADEMCGHIEHYLPQKTAAAFVQAIAPGIMGMLTGFPIFAFGFANLRFMGCTFNDSAVLFILCIAAIYVGISIMCSLHPSYEVALNLWEIVVEKIKSKSAKSKIIGVLLLFPSRWAYLGAILEKFSVPVVVWAVFLAVAFLV